MPLNRRFLSTLGLCKKAGKLIFGFDMVAESIIKGGARLVLLAPDLSCKSAKEIFRLTDRHKIDVIKMPATMDDMMRLIGKRAGILAITDEGLSELLKKLSGACQE